MTTGKEKSENDQKRDAILKKMLETPPKPNKPIKEKESDKKD